MGAVASLRGAALKICVYFLDELCCLRREYFGQLLSHVRVLDRLLQVLEHCQCERTALIRPCPCVLVEPGGRPVVQVQALCVVVARVIRMLIHSGHIYPKNPGDWLTERGGSGVTRRVEQASRLSFADGSGGIAHRSRIGWRSSKTQSAEAGLGVSGTVLHFTNPKDFLQALLKTTDDVMSHELAQAIQMEPDPPCSNPESPAPVSREVSHP